MHYSSSIEGYACEDAPAECVVVKGCGSAYVICSKVQMYIDLRLADMNAYDLGIKLERDPSTAINGRRIITYDQSHKKMAVDVIACAMFSQLRRRGGHVMTSMADFFTRLALHCNVFNNFGPEYTDVAKMKARAVQLGVPDDAIRRALPHEPRQLSSAEFEIATVGDLINTLQQLRDYAGEFEIYVEKLFEMTKKV